MIAMVAEETIRPSGIAGSGHAADTETNQSPDSPRNNKQQQPSSFYKSIINNNNNNNKSDETTSVRRIFRADVEDTNFSKEVNDRNETNSNKHNNSTYWYLLMTTYVPIIILWFRTSLLEHINLARTMVVEYLTKLVVVNEISEWISIPSWLEVILFQSTSSTTLRGGSSSSISSDKTWPPPALKALALLTIVALVVHPEGLTWILLGKVRDAIYSLFSALGRSLEFLLNDYGVFPTIIAAATLAAMFFLVFVVIRTLSPKKGKSFPDKHNNTLHNERKKKKKKGGNARHRNNHRSNNNYNNNNNNQHHHGRIKSPTPRSQQLEHQSVDNDSTLEAISPTSIPPPPPAQVPENDASSSPSLPLEKYTDRPLVNEPLCAASTSDNRAIESSVPTADDPASDETSIRSGVNRPVASKEHNNNNANKSRRRVTSASTADTTPLSDDLSCGSTSVRSFPSVSVNSNRSGGKKPKGSTPRRLKRHGTVKSPKNTERNSGKKNKSTNKQTTSLESPGTTSRWDVLKPDNDNAGKSNNNSSSSSSNNSPYGGHHGHSNGTPGSSNKKQNQRFRGNSRRTSNGRKGRQHPTFSAHNEESMNAMGSLRVNQGRSNANVSPIGATRHDSKVFSPPNNPFANSASPSLPTPPPGFQNFSHHDFEPKPTSLQYPHQQNQHLNSDLLADPLFETHLAMRLPQNNTSNNKVAGVSPEFFNSSESAARMIQQNPFRSNVKAIPRSSLITDHQSYQQQHHQANLDSQIEADLQELGGQMAGSILDF